MSETIELADRALGAAVRADLERIAGDLLDAHAQRATIGELDALDPSEIADLADDGDLRDVLADALCDIVAERLDERIQSLADRAAYDADIARSLGRRW